MREFRQPWRRVEIDGRRVRLQILDPKTAFEVEPEIIAALGDTLAFVSAAPNQLVGSVWRHATGNASGDVQSMVTDPVHGPNLAALSLHAYADVLATCITEASIAPRMVGRLFRRIVLGKLEINGEHVEDHRDYAAAKFRPRAKWLLMGAQIEQTFGPLWTRAPYRLKSQAHDYGVPVPKDVPVAVAWADNLSVRGSASSSLEILQAWTPVHMIHVVENTAHAAEIERRAADVARGGR